MKRNVDLTENQLFRSNFFKHYTSHGFNYQQMFYFDECFPDVIIKQSDGAIYKALNYAIYNEIEDFARGDSLIATGSSMLREIKLLARKRYNKKVCEECDKPIRIPWNGVLCSACINMYKKYERQTKAHATFPWSHYYSSISGIRSIPWLR